MTPLEDQNPFLLAMVTVSGSPPFPVVVLDDEAVISVDAIAPLAARLGRALTGTDSLFGLLQNWEHNFVSLCAAVAALGDPATGRHFRGFVASVKFFDGVAPIAWPRQVFCELTAGAISSDAGRFVAKLPSAITGPHAKVLVPDGSDGVIAEAKLGTVIAAPTYHASDVEASAAIAGYITVTDITRAAALEREGGADWLAAKSGPTFLPTGPWFVPAAFAGDPSAFDAQVSFNGEERVGWSGTALAHPPAAQVVALSAQLQLLPGDIICSGVTPEGGLSALPRLGHGDIIETAISGLGRQTLNCLKEVHHAYRGN